MAKIQDTSLFKDITTSWLSEKDSPYLVLGSNISVLSLLRETLQSEGVTATYTDDKDSLKLEMSKRENFVILTTVPLHRIPTLQITYKIVFADNIPEDVIIAEASSKSGSIPKEDLLTALSAVQWEFNLLSEKVIAELPKYQELVKTSFYKTVCGEFPIEELEKCARTMSATLYVQLLTDLILSEVSSNIGSTQAKELLNMVSFLSSNISKMQDWKTTKLTLAQAALNIMLLKDSTVATTAVGNKLGKIEHKKPMKSFYESARKSNKILKKDSSSSTPISLEKIITSLKGKVVGVLDNGAR